MLSSGRSKASEASKSSSWKARPSATWAKYEHVLTGSSVPGASSLAPASAVISKRLACRSMRASDTRSTANACAGPRGVARTSPARASAQRRPGLLLEDVDDLVAALARGRAEDHGELGRLVAE